MSPFVPGGSGGDTFLGSQTLSVNGNLDMTSLGSVIPAGLAFLKVIVRCRVHGNTNGFNWEHLWLTFNGDTTTNDYAWTVVNSNATTATAALATGTVGTGTSGILAGHAIADTAAVSPMQATGTILIWDPTNTNSPKTVEIMSNNVMSSFTSYTDVAPIKMSGGTFWVGPGAVTRITIQAVSGLLIAGSSMQLYGAATP